MLGLALVTLAAIGGFVLGLYCDKAEPSPHTQATIAAPAEKPAEVTEVAACTHS